jgi:hypothetical protein
MSGQMVLACEVPEDATPGSTFHVQVIIFFRLHIYPDRLQLLPLLQHNNRFFEVVTPDDASPGQTITIVVPVDDQIESDEMTGKNWFQSFGEKIATGAKQFDEKYKITTTVVESSKPGHNCFCQIIAFV